MRTSRTRQGFAPRLGALAGVILRLVAAAPVVAQDAPEEPDKASGQLWLAFRTAGADGAVLVTGSMYVVGEARSLLGATKRS